MRRILGIALIAACLPLYVTRAQAEESIKIGAIEILSGPNSKYGVAIKRGFDLALEKINSQKMLNRPLEIIHEDSAGIKEQALNAARLLIGAKKVPLILGPTLSGEMFAVGPVANQRKIPIIGTSTTAIGITDIGEYVFRTALPESDVVPVLLRTARDKLGIHKVAVMYANDDTFSKSSYDVMRAELDKLGIITLTTETFSVKDSDYTAQLTKIKGLDPDAIVVASYVEAGAGIMLAKKSLGISDKIRILGGNGLNSSKIGEIAGSAADGTLVASPWFVGKPELVNQEFVRAFKAKYDIEPDQFAAQAYDTLFLAAEAIRNAGSLQPEEMRESLEHASWYGVLGKLSFGKNRSPADTSGVLVLEMKDGRFQALN